jgi:hypothetical protein
MRGALLHAARELLGEVVLKPLQAHLGDEVPRLVLAARAWQTFFAQAKAHVLLAW